MTGETAGMAGPPMFPPLRRGTWIAGRVSGTARRIMLLALPFTGEEMIRAGGST